jgi:hypothetical protein
VSLTWDDDGVRNAWLRVTVNAGFNFGLARPDVFYFGSLVGETGDANTPTSFKVTALDLGAVKRAMNTDAPVTSRVDFNRDGRVNALDLAKVKANLNRPLPALAAPAAAPAASPFFSLVIPSFASPALAPVWDEPEASLFT